MLGQYLRRQLSLFPPMKTPLDDPLRSDPFAMVVEKIKSDHGFTSIDKRKEAAFNRIFIMLTTARSGRSVEPTSKIQWVKGDVNSSVGGNLDHYRPPMNARIIPEVVSGPGFPFKAMV